MSKIIFLTENMTKAGGVVKVISIWSNYLINKGHEIEIISTVKGTPFFQLNSKIKFTILNLFIRNKFLKILLLPVNTLSFYLWIRKEKKVTLIINKSFYIEIFFILKKLKLLKNKKLIYLVHGGNSDFENHYKKNFLVSYRSKLIFYVFDKIVCLHQDTKEDLKKLDYSKVSYISNPLEFKIEKGLNKEKKILFLGRVTIEKGVDQLIMVWEQLAKNYPEWTLVIVGDGKDKKKCIELSKKIDKKQIQFVDETQNIEGFYKNSKIFVLPSLFDGMPMVILEAMSKGCYVISSKTTGGKRIIQDNENGFLFEIGNKEELKELIKNLIEKENSKIIEKAYESIKEYDIDNLYKKWKVLL